MAASKHHSCAVVPSQQRPMPGMEFPILEIAMPMRLRGSQGDNCPVLGWGAGGAMMA